MKLLTKLFLIFISALATNRYFANEYRILSEELAMEQMTAPSAQMMEQVAEHQNLIVFAPAVILLIGTICIKEDIIDLLGGFNK